MSATYELFQRWKAAKKFESDAAAMRSLSLHPTALTPWKAGRNGSAAVIEKMAKDMGEDPVPVILQAFAEAARDAEDRKTLGRLARKLGAACIALFMLAPMFSSSAHAATMQGHDLERKGLYIMRNARRWLRAAAGSVRGWFHPPMELARCNPLALSLPSQ
jgi:hypothetical protein